MSAFATAKWVRPWAQFLLADYPPGCQFFFIMLLASRRCLEKKLFQSPALLQHQLTCGQPSR